jgi:HEAT repeat protein
MKRIVPQFAALLMLVPVLASAQTPRRPPVPPPPPVPQTMPVPPAPPTPPVAPQILDRMALEDALRATDLANWRMDADQARALADQAREAARISMADMRVDMEGLRWNLDGLQSGPFMTMGSQSSENGTYSSGLSLMSDRKYEEAIVRFDKVIAQKATRADAALYYKAFCQAKLGQSAEAITTLASLKSTYAKSAYLPDARMLEADVKKLGPSQVDDDDIKILAIQSLRDSQNPDQAVDLLQGQISKTNSLKVKQRAIVVLAQIDTPKAHQALLGYAKGGGNPDLQAYAIRYLGNARSQKTTSAELIEIYNSSTDADIRGSVITAFRNAGDKGSLIHIAQGFGPGSATVVSSSGGDSYALAANVANRAKAITSLADLASPQELFPLYQKEENKDLRSQWVSLFSSMGAVDQLLQIVKTEKDPAVKNRAIRALGNLKAEKTGPSLVEMYGTGDKDTKNAVISALGNQNNAESLVAIARKETDRDLRLQVVTKLTEMARTSKVAMDYLMEIIK